MRKGWGLSGLSEEEKERRRASWESYASRHSDLVVPPGGNFYDSGRWALLRNKTLMMHGIICQRCGTRGDSVNPIQVDHIKPRSRYPHLECDPDNLQVLCKNCNHEKSNVDETDYRPKCQIPKAPAGAGKSRFRRTLTR